MPTATKFHEPGFTVQYEQSHSVHFNPCLKDCKIIPIFLSILTSTYDTANLIVQ